MTGLAYTRDYRSVTFWLRAMFRFISRFTFDPMESLAVNVGLIKSRQKTLVWTKKEERGKGRASVAHASRLSSVQPPPDSPSYVASPSFEFTDYSARPDNESAIQDTPAMAAHSLFPPAITSRRPRNESDASSSLPIFEQYRRSDDSGRPLMQRLSDVHRSRASSSQRGHHLSEDRRSSDERSSGEYAISLASPHGEPSTFRGRQDFDVPTVHGGQGYQRANSDSGSPPDVLGGGAGDQDPLGISIPPRDVNEGEGDKLVQ
jgi:hypothetical protein